MATLKRKRVSKKNKKSWRKNVDVTDVENFLEDQRLEERLGQKFEDTQNADLFSIDTSGEPPQQVQISPTKTVNIKQKSMRLREVTTPKCYALLERRSAVPDPVVKRNHIKQKEKITKLQTTGVTKRKKKGKEGCRPPLNLRDIWSEQDNTRELNGLAVWMTPDTIRHTLQNTGHKRKLRPRDLKDKPSPLVAVEAPHPGTSYNPSLADHQQLIRAVAATEAELQKKEKHIERVTTKMFRKIPREEAEKSWITEMSAGLEDDPDSSPEMGDYSTVNAPVQRKKKTLQKRRKLREERARKLVIEARKMEKRKRSDVNNKLPQIKKNIEKTEVLSTEYQQRKKERKESQVGDTKVLGKTRYEAPPLEFQSPNELVGSLRQLKPEGSVLSDRFLSLQKRNVVEPTLKRNIRRAKVKRFVKASHKMGWESKGY